MKMMKYVRREDGWLIVLDAKNRDQTNAHDQHRRREGSRELTVTNGKRPRLLGQRGFCCVALAPLRKAAAVPGPKKVGFGSFQSKDSTSLGGLKGSKKN